MDASPSLSIIVANYNNDKFICECLDSILKQSFKDLEIILFDDASTDNSLRIIKEYKNKFPEIVKEFYSPINKGVAYTRHKAILNTRGKYISTLDSDDYYFDEHKLESEMKLISKYEEKNKDIIAFSNIIHVDQTGDIKYQWPEDKILEGDLFDSIITRSCMIPRDFTMKKSAYFKAGKYDFQFKIFEDWDLKIRLSKIYPFYCTGINGIAYRQHSQGLSNTPYRQLKKILLRVFFKNFHLVEESKKDNIRRSFFAFMST